VLEVSTHLGAVSVHVGAFSVEHRGGPVGGRDRGGHELLHHDQQRSRHHDVNGRPRFERYYSSTAAESRSIFSVTKSVTSTLVGIAISEGRLRLDERLSQMLPRYAAEMKPSVAAGSRYASCSLTPRASPIPSIFPTTKC
jgi:hypothetical protein